MAIPALIGVGASLLGGLFGRSPERKAIAAQNEYNKPINIRARAEEAGFNPLAFIGPGVGQQVATGGTNYMGAAIADAGLMLADSLSKKQEATAVTALQKQNKELAEQVKALTLRPEVDGVYARRQAVPTTQKALGANDEKPSVSPYGVVPNGYIDVPDPKLDRGTSSVIDGKLFESAPGFSPVAIMEEEYGDLISLPYGVVKLAADTAWNAHRLKRDRESEAWKRDLIGSYNSKPSLRPYPDKRFDPKRADGYVWPSR